jgi:hypothetical protein
MKDNICIRLDLQTIHALRQIAADRRTHYLDILREYVQAGIERDYQTRMIGYTGEPKPQPKHRVLFDGVEDRRG